MGMGEKISSPAALNILAYYARQRLIQARISKKNARSFEAKPLADHALDTHDSCLYMCNLSHTLHTTYVTRHVYEYVHMYGRGVLGGGGEFKFVILR